MLEKIPIIFIISYYFFLVFAILVNLRLSNKQFKLLNLLFFISILLVAYNFEPTQEMDLYRYYSMLDEVKYRELNWDQIVNYGPYNQTVLTSIYFNVMSKVQNRSWFSVFPTGIVFTLIFIVADKFKNKYDISYRSVAFFIINIISVSSLLLIITGVRQNVAWALLMVAVYYDFFHKDRKLLIAIVLYIIPMLVHLSAVPFIFIRIILILVKKFKYLKYLLLLWPLSLVIFTNAYSYLPSTLQSALNVLGNYVNNIENYKPTAQFVIAIIGYFLILILVNNVKKQVSSSKFITKDYFNYYYLVLLFGISSIFIPTLFSRTFEFVMYISLPMITVVLSSKFILKKQILLLIILMFIVLFYWQDLMLGYFF